MRTHVIDLTVILGTAVLVAAAFGTLLAPEVTVAEDDNLTSMLVGRPQAMEADGVTLKVDLGKAVRTPGRCAPLELTATNTADEERVLAVLVKLTSMRTPSPFSRTMPLAETVWTEAIEAKVAPGSTTTIRLSPDIAMAGNTIVGVVLTVGDRTVRAAGFAVNDGAPASSRLVQLRAG